MKIAFLVLIILNSCASKIEGPDDFFPLDGEWRLKKISCPASPLPPQAVTQYNSLLDQQTMFYDLRVVGRNLHLQQKYFPKGGDSGSCEYDLKISLKEIPTSYFMVDRVEVKYQRARWISEEQCERRSDWTGQSETAFELSGHQLRIFQDKSIDAKRICSGTSPLISYFERIY